MSSSENKSFGEKLKNTDPKKIKRELIDQTTSGFTLAGAGMAYVGANNPILGWPFLAVGVGTLAIGTAANTYSFLRTSLPGAQLQTNAPLLQLLSECISPISAENTEITEQEQIEINAFIEQLKQQVQDQKEGKLPSEAEKKAAEKKILQLIKNQDWRKIFGNSTGAMGRVGMKVALFLLAISGILVTLGYLPLVPFTLGAAAVCGLTGTALIGIGSLIKHFNQKDQEDTIMIHQEDFVAFLEKKGIDLQTQISLLKNFDFVKEELSNTSQIYQKILNDKRAEMLDKFLASIKNQPPIFNYLNSTSQQEEMFSILNELQKKPTEDFIPKLNEQLQNLKSKKQEILSSSPEHFIEKEGAKKTLKKLGAQISALEDIINYNPQDYAIHDSIRSAVWDRIKIFAQHLKEDPKQTIKKIFQNAAHYSMPFLIGLVVVGILSIVLGQTVLPFLEPMLNMMGQGNIIQVMNDLGIGGLVAGAGGILGAQTLANWNKLSPKEQAMESIWSYFEFQIKKVKGENIDLVNFLKYITNKKDFLRNLDALYHDYEIFTPAPKIPDSVTDPNLKKLPNQPPPDQRTKWSLSKIT